MKTLIHSLVLRLAEHRRHKAFVKLALGGNSLPFSFSRREGEKNEIHPLTMVSRASFQIKTFKKIWQGERPALIFLSCVTLLSGRATFGFKQPELVTVGQVIEMSKEGVPPEAIVRKCVTRKPYYRFTAAQLAELHDLGIADPVLDYMQRSYIEAERREQSREDWGLGMGGLRF